MQLKAIISVTLLLLLVVFSYIFSDQLAGFQSGKSHQGTKVCLDGDDCQTYAKLKVKLAPDPVLVEEEIQAILFLSKGWKLERGWVEGVNMYMGKTPLLIQESQSQKNQYQAVFFLGSCSEPDMNWRLTTQWKHEKTQQSVTAFYDFSTHID
ncbi:hypothetical protein [Alteromonas sp. a30]|uniref:hypothetical protein n=1 Tax=Alteromonas sp. a30 TaxID=2730917 RepID=UPI0022829A92|nr:hypothetical protein [Alteromonas sp. a30]MCY7293861.1 hypothetical protein [Alteromonas sp. a30]